MTLRTILFACSALTLSGLAACGSSEPAAPAVPDDVTAFVTRADACRSWSDEARANGPNADATHEEVMAAWTENQCETLGADATALRTANADNAAVISALDAAMAPPEGAEAAAAGSAPAAATPATGEAGLATFIAKAETCGHVAGEGGDRDSERQAELNKTWADTGCEFLEAETKATRDAYAGDDAVLARVNAAVEPLGY